jgi:hypothetical protein
MAHHQEVEVTTYDNRKIKAVTLESTKGGRHPIESQHTWPSRRYVSANTICTYTTAHKRERAYE